MMGQCYLRKVTDDSKLREVVNMPEGCAAIQKDGCRLEEWADRSLMKLEEKHKVLHLRRNNPMN